MTRAPTICSRPNCPNVQPCPIHGQKPWQSSTRRTRTGSGSRQQKNAAHVMYRDDGVCHVCGQPGADEVDHVVPLAEGGDDHVSNMAPIHARPCHAEKTQLEARRARERNQRAQP